MNCISASANRPTAARGDPRVDAGGLVTWSASCALSGGRELRRAAATGRPHGIGAVEAT